MFIMVNIGIFNASSKFESQILSYKQDTEIDTLCFVTKDWVLLLFKCLVIVYKCVVLVV